MLELINLIEEVLLFLIAVGILTSPAWIGFLVIRSLIKKLERKANIRV